MKIKINEFIYWHIRRPAHKLFLNFIWHIPRPIVYWCIIRAAVRVEPNSDPYDVTAEQMLEAIVK